VAGQNAATSSAAQRMSNEALVRHLESCVERARVAPLSFGTVFGELGRDGIVMTLLVMCLPFLQPISLGPLASAGGLVLAGIGWQLVRGRNDLWLPAKVRDAALESAGWERLLGVCRWLVGLFAKVTRTRMTSWTDGDRGHRTAGWFAIVGGLLLAIPFGGVPFNNMLPALIVASAAIAVLERDGLMFAMAAFWVIATLLYFGLIAWAFYYFGTEIKDWIAANLPSWLG
jgi:hypothetical protein